MQRKSSPPLPFYYYFSRVKKTHIENGKAFITFFARLTIKTPRYTEYVWAEIEEIVWNQAGQRLQKVPNGMYTYQIPENVFRELERLSQKQQKSLYSLTPLYQTATFKRLE
ncbi:hypothetical protein [Planococcus alpniumensis]|uniref:hypothetical protein n=1 Tax=Planococcus alpniumensis TaxID=2708345 RepID=UPI001B8B8F33|nr:hypothetical protein [Planococcus sp. MSAK28401]